jgi:hypothetical protein
LSDTRLLDIEHRLADDRTGVERDRIMERLATLAGHARAALDKGVTPSHANALRSLMAAIDAAQVVVSRVWSRFHERAR